MASGARFTGWMQGPALRALRIGDEPVDTLFLGGRTKTQGSALLEVDHTSVPEPVEQRGNTVVLRLLGPGAFVDEFGFPSAAPDRQELSEALGVEVRNVKPQTRWCQVEGWHIASGLRKPVERAVQAGSTYLVTCAEPASEQARRTLMARGIGLRRREGFGALYTFDRRPLTVHELSEKITVLRDSAELREHLPMLRRRAQRMQQEPVDDTEFHDRISVGDPYADALKTLLDVVSPQLFHEALENCVQPDRQEEHQ